MNDGKKLPFLFYLFTSSPRRRRCIFNLYIIFPSLQCHRRDLLPGFFLNANPPSSSFGSRPIRHDFNRFPAIEIEREREPVIEYDFVALGQSRHQLEGNSLWPFAANGRGGGGGFISRHQHSFVYKAGRLPLQLEQLNSII